MNPPTSPPADNPFDKPSVSRIYDYFLGGFAHFAVDRAAAEQLRTLDPTMPDIMRANRAFLRRAVEFLVAQGIEQFLDIGSGIPTAGNVHEIAQGLNPATHVVYVDNDPVAVAHSRLILSDHPQVAVIQADARQPAAILAHPEVRRLLDFGQPLAVLLVALLHFVPDDDEAYGLVRTLREALPAGSYLVIAHGTDEGATETMKEQGQGVYAQTASPLKARPRTQIARFFEGLEPVEPGLVYVPLWHPDGMDDRFHDHPERSRNLAGVARKR